MTTKISEKNIELVKSTVQVQPYFDISEYLLSHTDLDAFAGMIGRTTLRMIAPRVRNEDVRKRLKEWLGDELDEHGDAINRIPGRA